MKKRVEVLLARYYEAETTLAEEKELRKLLAQVPGFKEEKQFFLGMEVFKTLEPSARATPKRTGQISLWQKVAAVAAVLLSLTWLFVNQQVKKEEAMAYVQVMEAFELIQGNMKKGTVPLGAMQDIKHLSKTNEIFNINNKEQ